LTGNWDVVQGQMISPTIGMTRTEEDSMWHIFHAIQIDAQASWVFVVDNLNTHCSETLVRYVARSEGINESTLGQKGKSGILKSMATRQASSWLNEIEIVFGIVYPFTGTFSRRPGLVLAHTFSRWECVLAYTFSRWD